MLSDLTPTELSIIVTCIVYRVEAQLPREGSIGSHDYQWIYDEIYQLEKRHGALASSGMIERVAPTSQHLTLVDRILSHLEQVCQKEKSSDL